MADDAIEKSIKNLDMSEAARMKRAKDQGFGDEVFSHYTYSDFDEFDPMMRGDNTLSNASSPGLAMTSLVGDFANIGGGDHLVNSYQGGKKIDLLVPDRTDLYEVDSLDDFASELQDHALNVLGMTEDEIMNPDDIFYDYKKVSDSYVKELEERGYKGVIFQDEEFGGESVSIFRPGGMRKVSAAFNPSAKNSPSLLASSAPLALSGPLAAFSSKEAEANPLTANVTGTIEGPKRPNVLKVSQFIDRHDDILMDDLLGGVTTYLNKLAYDDKITFKDRLMAALDLI